MKHIVITPDLDKVIYNFADLGLKSRGMEVLPQANLLLQSIADMPKEEQKEAKESL